MSWPGLGEWRPIPGHEDYEASRSGKIRRSSGGQGARAGHVLAQHDGGGSSGRYYRVQLSEDGQRTTKSVHRLVARAFHDNRGPGDEVDHIDGDPGNNRANNLRWMDSGDNRGRRDAPAWGGDWYNGDL